MPSLKFLKDEVSAADIISIDCETFGIEAKDEALDPWKGKMAGFSISTEDQHFYVPLNHIEATELKEKVIFQELKEILESKPWVGHNVPFDAKWFYVQYGVNLIDNIFADTRIMAMAFDENRNHRLKDLCRDWLKMDGNNFDELFSGPFNQVPLNIAKYYACGDTHKTLTLFKWMMGMYDKRPDLQSIKRLVFDIEMPVCREFIKSDLRGIHFDIEKAKELDDKFAEEATEIERKIFGMFKEKINLSSPAQLSKKLFQDLGLPDYDNGSTGVKTLKKLKQEHPVIPLILSFREVEKLRQAFTNKLPNEVKFDGKIHPWHNTWGAATGRFTCNSPNTQQIPAKRPEIRKLFKSAPGRILVSIDYSQIELRVLAHLAQEKVLIDAFNHGKDIHSTTAAMISNGRFSYEDIERNKDVEGSQEKKYRGQAKVVNFGLIYGMSDKGLAATLEISVKEAAELIKGYFKGYPGIQGYMDEQHKKVKHYGFVTDAFQRKRRLHAEINSGDHYKISGALRQCGNFPIQSTAGSILKKAIVDLRYSGVLEETDSRILLQVHDELNFDCPADISLEDLMKIKETMENAFKLIVPVRCDVEIYPERWMEKVNVEEYFGIQLQD
jgi:DNA polymerase-1